MDLAALMSDCIHTNLVTTARHGQENRDAFVVYTTITKLDHEPIHQNHRQSHRLRLSVTVTDLKLKKILLNFIFEDTFMVFSSYSRLTIDIPKW